MCAHCLTVLECTRYARYSIQGRRSTVFAGCNVATGTPYLVIVIFSPLATRSKSSGRCVFALYALMLFMNAPVVHNNESTVARDLE